jgi:peptide deformylase
LTKQSDKIVAKCCPKIEELQEKDTENENCLIVRTAAKEVVRAKFVVTNLSGKNMNESTKLVAECE